MSAAACAGKLSPLDHDMDILGNCSHHPKGSIRDYEASRCRDCGVAMHRGRRYAYGRGIEAVEATAATCAVLAEVPS